MKVAIFSLVFFAVAQFGTAMPSLSLPQADKEVDAMAPRKRFIYTTSITQWEGARQDCIELLGTYGILAEMRTTGDFDQFRRDLSSITTGYNYWIGARYDTILGDFVWDDMTTVVPPSKNFWEPGYPHSQLIATTRIVYNPSTRRFRTELANEEHRSVCM